MIKKEYIEPQLEVVESEDLMQVPQVSVNVDEETTQNDSLEFGFDEE